MHKGLSEMVTGMSPPDIRAELTEGTSDDLFRRRAIIGLSLVGLGIAAAATLLQTGIVKHLPDPPVGNFDADEVITSDEAYVFGIPDATLALAGLAMNVPIAAYGSSNRAKELPIVPVVAAAKAAAEAGAAAWYFYQMATKKKSWCAYCIAAAGVYFSILALTLPEAATAVGLKASRQERN
jgi:uncharacterized membrane protein